MKYDDEQIIDDMSAEKYSKQLKVKSLALGQFYEFQEKVKIGNINNIIVRISDCLNKQINKFELFKRYLDKENSSKLEKYIANIKEQYNNLNLIYADKVEDKTSHFDNNLSLLKSCLLNQNIIVENYLELSNFEVNQKILPVINKYLNESLQCMEFLIGLLK